MISPKNVIVSTDLDGTLLDHHNYDWHAAKPALRFLQEHDIPIVFNTSKTFAETLTLQKSIGVDGPLIIENGSGLATPKNNPLIKAIEGATTTRDESNHVLMEFGQNRDNILRFIKEQRARHGEILSGFNDWSIEEIAEHTGLSENEAALSAQKLFSEPFHWLKGECDLQRFIQEAQNEHLKITKGGRFYHIQGNTDKAKPIVWLQRQLEVAHKRKFTLVCLGDNHNDVAMLNAADIPVCVRSPNSDYPPIGDNPRSIRTKQEGPAGWHEAMTQIFKGFGA